MAEALGSLTGSIQGTITGLGNKGMQWLDSVFPPESRAKVMNAITKFSSEKPMLAVRLHGCRLKTSVPDNNDAIC